MIRDKVASVRATLPRAAQLRRKTPLETSVRMRLTILFSLGLATFAQGADLFGSYSEAQLDWTKHKDSAEFQTYASEFVQFNNHFHIDERGGCYALGKEQIGLMLVITHSSGSQFATIEKVLSDHDSPKAHCFMNSYQGLPTKVPPYVPFVLPMSMG
jgi:hypothetical protein